MSAIVIEQVSKRFAEQGRAAVDDCSMSVAAGEFVVLLGPSGCGKTTLLKMVNRLYEPTSGRIQIDGVDVRDLPATTLRRRIGYVIQQTGLFPHMPVAANIAVVPRLLGWERGRIEARIDELLALVGLPVEYRTRYPRQLSGGEQQRVGIARALAADPALILMDEPFSAIDAITRTRLQGELLAIQQRVQKTILFVTHDVEEALRLADRLVVMRAGKIVQFDTPLRVLTQPADAGVSQLLGADDVLRKLSLLRTDALPLGPTLQEAPPIDAATRMREALGLLLASGASALTVMHEGQALGSFGLEQLRAAVAQQAAPATVA